MVSLVSFQDAPDENIEHDHQIFFFNFRGKNWKCNPEDNNNILAVGVSIESKMLDDDNDNIDDEKEEEQIIDFGTLKLVESPVVEERMESNNPRSDFVCWCVWMIHRIRIQEDHPDLYRRGWYYIPIMVAWKCSNSRVCDSSRLETWDNAPRNVHK